MSRDHQFGSIVCQVKFAQSSLRDTYLYAGITDTPSSRNLYKCQFADQTARPNESIESSQLEISDSELHARSGRVATATSYMFNIKRILMH